MTHFVLPSKYDEAEDIEIDNEKGMLDLLKIPSITLAAYRYLNTKVDLIMRMAKKYAHGKNIAWEVFKI